MAQKKTFWVTDDGAQFETEDAAIQHENSLAKAARISKALTEYGLYAATAGGTAKAIIDCWPTLKTIVEGE